MNTLFAKLGDIAAKIATPYSLAALALLLIHFSLYFVRGIPDDAKPWLLTSTLAASVVMVIVLRPIRTALRSSAESEASTDSLNIRELIDSSSLPMYLTDGNLVVAHCNDHLTSLINSNSSSVIGKHLFELVTRFGARVPDDRRAAFMMDQQDLMNKTMSDLSPHAERVEYIDNRLLQGNPYQGLYRVWIHADKVRSERTKKEIGVFVVYQVTPIKKVPPAT